MECCACETLEYYVSYCNVNNLTVVATGERTKRVTLPNDIRHLAQLSCNRTTVTASLISGHEVIQVTCDGEHFQVSAVQCAKDMSWTGLLWLQKSCRFLLCCDDGFVASERTADGTALNLSKQKLNVVSEIGPQNKLFTGNGKSIVKALHGVGETSDDFLILSSSKQQRFLLTRHIRIYKAYFVVGAVAGMKAITWATADFVASTITVGWTVHTSDVFIVPAHRNTGTGDKPSTIVWTCVGAEQQMWVLTASGTIAKFALHEHGCATAILIVSESAAPVAGSSEAATIAHVLLGCADGCFLYLTLRSTATACSVQHIQEIRYRSLLHRIQRSEHSPGATLLPCFSKLCVWPPGSVITERDQPPSVLLGYHERFGVEVIILGECGCGTDTMFPARATTKSSPRLGACIYSRNYRQWGYCMGRKCHLSVAVRIGSTAALSVTARPCDHLRRYDICHCLYTVLFVFSV
jgi:hypothetical protein